MSNLDAEEKPGIGMEMASGTTGVVTTTAINKLFVLNTWYRKIAGRRWTWIALNA